MVRLKRAQVGRAAGIDTTVKSARGLARAFAPTWEMVMGVKSGTLTESAYTELYEQILGRVPLATWRWLYAQGQGSEEVTLLCYCRDGWFCHTHLIVAYACAHYPKAFVDGR